MLEYRTMINQPDGLSRLSTLAEKQYEAEAKVVTIEADLAAMRRTVRDLSETQIPELMDELGMNEFKTTAGIEIKVDNKIRCGDLKRADGLEWLRENGEGGLIKSEIVVPFSKGNDQEASDLADSLEGDGFACKLNQRVAWNSLASTIKGLLEDGVDVPLKTLGAHLQRVTKVSV